MYLYLMQHGEALGKDVDPQRPLSETGERDVTRMADMLNDQSPSLERIMHSGKRRAEQSAGLMAKAVAPGLDLEQDEGLSPDADVVNLAEQIQAWRGDTLLVSHMPMVARLAAYLLAGEAQHEGFAFSPGALMCLERVAPGQWQLHWFVPPALLNPA